MCAQLFSNFGTEFRFKLLRIRASIGKGELRQIGYGFFPVPPFIQQQRRPRHFISVGQRFIFRLCNVNNTKIHLSGPNLPGEIGFDNLFHAGFNRNTGRAAFCPVETKHFDTIILLPIGNGFSRIISAGGKCCGSHKQQ